MICGEEFIGIISNPRARLVGYDDNMMMISTKIQIETNMPVFSMNNLEVEGFKFLLVGFYLPQLLHAAATSSSSTVAVVSSCLA